MKIKNKNGIASLSCLLMFCGVCSPLYATGSSDEYDALSDPEDDPFGIYDPIDITIGTNLPEGQWRIIGNQTIFSNGQNVTLFGFGGESSVVFEEVPGFIRPPIKHVTFADNDEDVEIEVTGVYLPDFNATIAKARSHSSYRTFDEKLFAPDADLDGDGYSNLAEWAFGMDLADTSRSARYRQDVYAVANPSSAFPSVTGPPVVSFSNDQGESVVKVCYSRFRADLVPNLRYLIEISEDGELWSEADAEIRPLNVLNHWQRNEASIEVSQALARNGVQARVRVILDPSYSQAISAAEDSFNDDAADGPFGIYDPVDIGVGTNLSEGLWRIVGNQTLFNNGEDVTLFGVDGESPVIFHEVPGFITPPAEYVSFSDYGLGHSTGTVDVKGLYIPGFRAFMEELENRGAGVSSQRQGSQGDFDGDGISNLQEWAFGMNVENFDHIQTTESGLVEYRTVTTVKGPPGLRKVVQSGGSDYYSVYFTRVAPEYTERLRYFADNAGSFRDNFWVSEYSNRLRYHVEYSQDGESWAPFGGNLRSSKSLDQWERVSTYAYLPKLAQGDYKFRVRVVYSEAVETERLED